MLAAGARSAEEGKTRKDSCRCANGFLRRCRTAYARSRRDYVYLNIRSGPSFAVANAYENWYDLTDKEVIRILKKG